MKYTNYDVAHGGDNIARNIKIPLYLRQAARAEKLEVGMLIPEIYSNWIEEGLSGGIPENKVLINIELGEKKELVFIPSKLYDQCRRFKTKVIKNGFKKVTIEMILIYCIGKGHDSI